MRKLVTVLLGLLCVASTVIGQGRVITGYVVDQDNIPIPSVSVQIKGTTTGTSADTTGKFSINASSTSVLVFSAINFTQKEVQVGNKSEINVTLIRSASTIEEVVVTALGIKREKKALGYAVSEIKGDMVSNVGNLNVVNSLNGKAPGVQVVSSGGAPGQASRIVIRGGAKSVTGSNQPLFVVDGIPISNDNDGSGTSTEVEGKATPNRAADINPADIESVSILKGSAASVLYGNRGANGVILITTKSGKGRAGQPVVTFNSSIGLDNPLRLPEFQQIYAQGNGSYVEGTSLSWGPRITGQQVFSSAKGENVTLAVHDPRKEFLRTGSVINNNISVSQSKDKSTYFFSAGLSRQNSIVPNQDFSKANIRLNVTNQLSSKLSLSANINYVRSWGNVPDLGQSGSNPFFALFNMPVSWNIKDYGYVRPDGRQINFRGGAFDNPLWSVNKTFFNTISDRIIGVTTLNYNLVQGISLTYRLGIDQMYDNRKDFKDQRTGSFQNGYLENELLDRQELNSTFFVNVDKKLTNDLRLTFTGGQDYNQRKYRKNEQVATALVAPGNPYLYNAASFRPDLEINEKRRLLGLFGDLKLDYKSYLFLGLTARREWTSTLSKENRSYTYPGVNASFIFSDALNLKSDVFSYGKLRAGYAVTARDADPYMLFNTYVVPNYTVAAGFGDGFVGGSAPIVFPFNSVPGYTYTNILNNPLLRAEKTKEIEVGTELRFLKDRIGVEVTYFSNRNSDGIVEVDVSPAAGASQLVVNSGLTTVKGWEFALNVVPIKKRNFTWDVNLNFSRIRSKVVETYPGVEQIYLGGFNGNPAIFAIKGERYGSIVGMGYDRNENGEVLVDVDGGPLFVSGINLGYVEPDWTGGIRNSFTIGNLGVDFLIDARHGGYIYNGTEELLDFYGVSKKTEGRELDYIFPGVNESDGRPNTIVTKQDYAYYNFYQGNEEYVYKNNWVRLREANISYNFNFGNNFLKSLTVGLFGRNLWLSTNVPHVDPETSSWGTGNGQGATRMDFPSLRSFGFNVKAVF